MPGSDARHKTPPELARKWGVATDKVYDMIRRGYLRAINLAVDPNGRPRWRVSEAEIVRFEESRMSKPPAEKGRKPRRRAIAAGKEWF